MSHETSGGAAGETDWLLSGAGDGRDFIPPRIQTRLPAHFLAPLVEEGVRELGLLGGITSYPLVSGPAMN